MWCCLLSLFFSFTCSPKRCIESSEPNNMGGFDLYHNQTKRNGFYFYYISHLLTSSLQPQKHIHFTHQCCRHIRLAILFAKQLIDTYRFWKAKNNSKSHKHRGFARWILFFSFLISPFETFAKKFNANYIRIRAMWQFSINLWWILAFRLDFVECWLHFVIFLIQVCLFIGEIFSKKSWWI